MRVEVVMKHLAVEEVIAKAICDQVGIVENLTGVPFPYESLYKIYDKRKANEIKLETIKALK